MALRRLWRTFNIRLIQQESRTKCERLSEFDNNLCSSSSRRRRRRSFNRHLTTEILIKKGKTSATAENVTNPALIPVCNSAEDLEEARRLYEMMKELGMKLQPSCYQTLLDGCCKFGTPDETLAIVADMKDSGVVPDGRAYKSLVSSFAKAGLLNEAFDIFQRFRDEKIQRLDRSLCSTMVWLYCQANRPRDAETLLEMLQQDHHQEAAAISHNVVISAYERAGCYSDAIRVFKGMNPPLGQTTCRLVLRVHHKAGDMDSYLKLMFEWEVFDSRSLEVAIDFYASENRFTDAERLFKSLCDRSIHLSLRGYTKLMEIFAKAGHASMVDRVYRRMCKVLTPDATSKRWLLIAYLKAGSFRIAMELYGEIAGGSDRFVELDEESCLLLVKALVRSQRFFEAMKLAMQMRKARMNLEEEVYNAVVTGMLVVENQEQTTGS